MIDTYINIDKEHKNFEDLLKSSGVKKLVIKNIQTPKQIHLFCAKMKKKNFLCSQTALSLLMCIYSLAYSVIQQAIYLHLKEIQ